MDRHHKLSVISRGIRRRNSWVSWVPHLGAVVCSGGMAPHGRAPQKWVVASCVCTNQSCVQKRKWQATSALIRCCFLESIFFFLSHSQVWNRYSKWDPFSFNSIPQESHFVASFQQVPFHLYFLGKIQEDDFLVRLWCQTNAFLKRRLSKGSDF